MNEDITKGQALYVASYAANTGNLKRAQKLIDVAPPADVAQVVRCKDCVDHRGWDECGFVYDEEKQKRIHRCEHKKGCYTFRINTPDDFYCGWGEKK